MDALFSFYFSFYAVYIYVNLSGFYNAQHAISRALMWRTLDIPLS